MKKIAQNGDERLNLINGGDRIAVQFLGGCRTLVAALRKCLGRFEQLKSSAKSVSSTAAFCSLDHDSD
jgi:hypothetical protein